MRCYWCDSDRFDGVMENGDVISLEQLELDKLEPKDYVCAHCGHLVSEENPRLGDPKETIESLKEERDDVRAQLEQCLGERVETPIGTASHTHIAGQVDNG